MPNITLLIIIISIVFLIIAFKKYFRKSLAQTGSATPTHAGCVAYKKEEGATKILLVTARDKTNVWVLPKGRIEKNESPKKAALRELYEEAGAKGRPIKSLGKVQRLKQEGETITTQYFLVSVETDKGEMFSSEGRQMIWLSLPEAIEQATHSDSKEILRKL